MLSLLDKLIQQILMNGVTGLLEVTPGQPPSAVIEDQVGFQPPDDEWRKAVKDLQRNGLNVYLVDLRENRKLRSNEQLQTQQNGVVYQEPAPTRLNCHYLISAWSHTDISPLTAPTLDEHVLLYQAAAALLRQSPFNPSRFYATNPTPLNAWPPRYQNVDLPTVIAPPEGFLKLAEFWGTMGQQHPWKPVIEVVVTLPVELLTEMAGYMVTTRITEYRQMDKPETAEIWIQIGGHVFKKSGNANVKIPDAWVGIETGGRLLQSTNTNELGRYTFSKLQSGQYKLKARATGFPEKERPIDVPSPTGEYDVTFP
jgi:hypothetical protein